MRKLILTTLGLVVAVGFAFGCGGGNEEEATAEAAPLTKAQFIKQADAVCKKAREAREAELDGWENGAASGKSEAELEAEWKEVVVPSIRREVEELEALVPPTKDEAKVSRMIGNLAKAGNVLGKEGVRGVPRAGIAEFEAETAAYGLKICPVT